jgi:PAS domain S-box-containing protein
MFLYHLKVKTRLLTGFALVLFLTVAVGGTAIFYMKKLADQTVKLYRHPYTVSNAVLRIQNNIFKIQTDIKDIPLNRDASSVRALQQHITKTEAQVYADFDIIRERFLGDKQRITEAEKLFAGWKTLRDKLIALSSGGKAAEKIKKDSGEYTDRLIREMGRFGEFANSKAAYFFETAQKNKRTAMLMMNVLVSAALIFGILFALMVSASVSRPLEMIIAFANKITSGDFSARIEETLKAEFAEAQKAIETMVSRLKEHQEKAEKISEALQKSNENLLLEIAGHKQTEASLRESEERFRATFEQAAVGITHIAENGRFLRINQKFCDIVGRSREEVLNLRYQDITHPDDLEKSQKLVQEFLSGEIRSYSVEKRYIRGDQSSVWVNLTTSSYGQIRDSSFYFISVIQDISDQKAMIKTLKENEERLNLVLFASNHGFWDWNITTGHLYLSEIWAKNLGYTPDEIEPDISVLEKICHPHDFPLVMKELRAHIDGHASAPYYRMEHRFQTKSGEWRWFLARGKIVSRDHKGRGIRMMGTSSDITGSKLAQERISRLLSEVERSNKELENFAYIASHDLQEPLRKIQSFGDILITEEKENLSEFGKNCVNRMQNAAKRMRLLIDKLLQYSRITTKANPFKRTELESIISEVLKDLEERIAKTGAQICFENLPAVYADAIQMWQLFQNLISNALKYQPEGNIPVISLHSRELGDTFCEITVSDNGVGFDEKYINRIFEPFQRLHGRKEFEGSGMGLAICKKIAERHGGSITARSLPGKGSAFIVRLPACFSKEEIYE